MGVSPEVQREFEAFTKDPARVQKYVQQAMTHGFFFALEEARIAGIVGPALFTQFYRVYNHRLAEKAREGLKEIKRIEAALHRMEMIAQQGRNRQKVERVYAYPDNDQFQNQLLAFQGWLASLFESYITMLSYIEGTNGAARKANEFASATLKLNQKRQQDGALSRHSEVFRSLGEL